MKSLVAALFLILPFAAKAKPATKPRPVTPAPKHIVKPAPAPAATERPPQFVLLAFDNCTENQSWRQVSEFLDKMEQIKKGSLRFTFFLSGTGLLSDKVKDFYVDPVGRKGKANIAFGGTDMSVVERVQWINYLYSRGNEIASHAVGHFNGQDWTVDQWRHEFDQYEDIFKNVVMLNGLHGEDAKKATLAFGIDKLTGFRAPYLGGGKNLNQVLMERGFAYDTSDTSQGWDPTTWPSKYAGAIGGKGLWNFGLSFLTLGMTAIDEAPMKNGERREFKRVKLPAMDYNFCFKATGGCPDKDPFVLERDEDAREMLAGYLRQFAANYNGNRAPLHIGHHFEQYRGGSYNDALLKFARTVCTQPEVRCTTYSELAGYLEKAGSQKRKDFQSGNFKKAAPLAFEDLWKQAFIPPPAPSL